MRKSYFCFQPSINNFSFEHHTKKSLMASKNKSQKQIRRRKFSVGKAKNAAVASFGLYNAESKKTKSVEASHTFLSHAEVIFRFFVFHADIIFLLQAQKKSCLSILCFIFQKQRAFHQGAETITSTQKKASKLSLFTLPL